MTHDFFSRLRSAAAKRRAYRATFGQLSALSDRELADLGLSRHNLREVARSSARV